MSTVAFDHLTYVYTIIVAIFILIPYIIYYLMSKTFSTDLKQKINIKFYSISLLFFSLFLIVELLSRESSWLGIYLIKDPSEFFWISTFLLAIYLYMERPLWDHIYFQRTFIESNLSDEKLVPIVQKTCGKLNGKVYRIPQVNDAYSSVGAGFLTDFDLRFDIGTNQSGKHGIEVDILNSLKNQRIIAILLFILFLPVILVRGQQIPVNTTITEEVQMLSWNLVIGSTTYTIDIVFWFVTGLILFCLFGLAVRTWGENLIIDFEEIFAKVKVEQAIKLPKLSVDLPKTSLGDIKDNLDAKIEAKRNSTAELLENEKKQEISNIIGDRMDLIKDKKEKINPEVLRLNALIQNIKKILRTTPIHKEISIKDIYAVVGKKTKTDESEIESIVIGLITKNEVKGEYDYWNKKYLGGNSIQRFIQKGLESSDTFMDKINSIKVKSDG
ncbi:MAG: hypothetical protein ACFFD1_05880, partial [Candidatus Thorarchaeota archaeon]